LGVNKPKVCGDEFVIKWLDQQALEVYLTKGAVTKQVWKRKQPTMKIRESFKRAEYKDTANCSEQNMNFEGG